MEIRVGAALLVLAALVQSTAACSDGPKEEEIGKSEEALDIDCIRSAKTRAELQACLGDVGDPSGGGGDGSGQSCSTSVSCTNGVCTCGDGRACEMATCGTTCRVCK